MHHSLPKTTSESICAHQANIFVIHHIYGRASHTSFLFCLMCNPESNISNHIYSTRDSETDQKSDRWYFHDRTMLKYTIKHTHELVKIQQNGR